MKKNYPISLVTLLFVLFGINLNAQNNFFVDKLEATFQATDQKRVIVPEKFRTISLDLNSMKTFLSSLPAETLIPDRINSPIIEIPMPNGTSAKFHIWERSVMAKGLEAKFPLIKTYIGQGITDRTAVLVLDITEMGFHAMILSSITGNVFVDPYDQSTLTNYISYYKKDLHKKVDFQEGLILNTENPKTESFEQVPVGQCVGANVRTYRLVVACSNQYAKAATGLATPTVSQTMARIVTTVNRVVGVYEIEVGIRMVLVANNDLVVFVNSATDPFNSSNSNSGALITASQTQITNIIGTSNFDIGHTFSTGGGGLAGLGVVCSSSQKARGITGSPQPTGDPYDIDYVAHEIGHQFKGNHTFNAATGSCSGNGSSAANCEPGSGSTIMAYAGICNGTNNLQNNSQAQFHGVSQAEIDDFSINGSGNTCAVITATGNNAPTVIAGTNYTIPISTPFILTGSGTDPDGDAITFSWEQMNTGASFGSWDGTQSSQTPLFRSFLPIVEPIRYFPQITDVVFAQTTIGERLPTITRNLNFRLTARDNVAGGGGVCFADRIITVSSSGGAFSVNYPSNSGVLWYQSQTQTITWNKGNTNLAPFNVANVAIELSTDGGFTFPITLIASTPNDGSEDIIVTNNFTFSARIRVRALNNVFYNMSLNDFAIAPNPVPVRWISFDAKKEKNNTVKLTWVVNEVDNHLYVIERSLNGEKFSQIATLPTATNNAKENTYNFFDENPFGGLNYYRIKQVDKNGGFTYSKIVLISFESNANSWIVYPNPSSEKVNLFSNSNYNNMRIDFFDAVGKLVYTQSKQRTVKGEVITIPISNLAKGVYSIRVQANNTETTTKKLLVQ